MGHRLSKITTKTGDSGTTGLGDGSRVTKTHPRVAAMGDIDELNSFVGLLLTEVLPERLREALTDVQRSTLNALSEGVAVFGTNGRLTLSNPRRHLPRTQAHRRRATHQLRTTTKLS